MSWVYGYVLGMWVYPGYVGMSCRYVLLTGYLIERERAEVRRWIGKKFL